MWCQCRYCLCCVVCSARFWKSKNGSKTSLKAPQQLCFHMWQTLYLHVGCFDFCCQMSMLSKHQFETLGAWSFESFGQKAWSITCQGLGSTTGPTRFGCLGLLFTTHVNQHFQSISLTLLWGGVPGHLDIGPRVWVNNLPRSGAHIWSNTMARWHLVMSDQFIQQLYLRNIFKNVMLNDKLPPWFWILFLCECASVLLLSGAFQECMITSY